MPVPFTGDDTMQIYLLILFPMVSIVANTDYMTLGAGAHLRFQVLSRQWSTVMDGRPHLFHNLPLTPQLLHQYQIILLGDRGTRV